MTLLYIVGLIAKKHSATNVTTKVESTEIFLANDE
jgi:hypothetical protein